MDRQEKENKIKVTFKKGNIYYFSDNSEHINSEEYKPIKIIDRVFNETTEQYEYKERIENAKLDWENELEMITKLAITGDNKNE